ncbi:phage head-binding domain-containing protein [Xenorhabdus bovienii]|uniref:phage head-binding domain-containing protein n=1 Tax=Xenorhabdus bovienii TaxID=40576 RepID=UPI0023B21B39|nr:phage head-binding domain-containing protein [Xenorhabdus bovienii]MDE9540629.1 phage head-binding domain-containing protein [Xenorhabdus bovienii]
MSEIIPNVVISMPSQLFTMARSFKACSNGRIYIGKIDTDPTIPENRIQVYMERENGDLVPAPQPIIINAAGFPVYAGQIAKFVTVEGHSMAVYDSYGAQQFYFPNVLKYDPDRLKQQLISDDIDKGDALIAVKQPIDGSIERTVHDWIADLVTVKDMGLKGDGVTDESPLLLSTLASLSSNNLGIIFPPGVYLCNADIVFDIPSYFMKGAILKPRIGAQLTFSNEIHAGRFQIFDTNDDFYEEQSAKTSVKIAKGRVCPEWFGAETTANIDDILKISDSSDAYRKAFRSSTGDFIQVNDTTYKSEYNCQKISLNSGHYRMDKPTMHGFFKDSIFFKVNGGGTVGKGMGNTIIVYTDLRYEGNSYFDASYGSYEMHEFKDFKCTAFNPDEDSPYFSRVGAIIIFAATDSLITNNIRASGAKYVRNDPDGTRRGGVGIQFESLVDHSFFNLLCEHNATGIAFSSCISTGGSIKGFSNSVSDFSFGNFVPAWPPVVSQSTDNIVSINGAESKACPSTPIFFGTENNNVEISGVVIDGRAEQSLNTLTYQCIGLSPSGGVSGIISGCAKNTNYGLVSDNGTSKLGVSGKTLSLSFILDGVYGEFAEEFAVVNIKNNNSRLHLNLNLYNSKLPAILSYSSLLTIRLSCWNVRGGFQDSLITCHSGNLIIHSIDESNSTYSKLIYADNV